MRRLAVHGLLSVTQPHLHRCDGIKWCCHHQTHPPCSQLHARLAGTIAGSAGRLLPYRFTPYPIGLGGNPFCCGCSQTPVFRDPPPLAVSWGNLAGASCDHQPRVGKFLYRATHRRPAATVVVRSVPSVQDDIAHLSKDRTIDDAALCTSYVIIKLHCSCTAPHIQRCTAIAYHESSPGVKLLTTFELC